MNTQQTGHSGPLKTSLREFIQNALAQAQIGLEHTEAMRRARADGIWPYIYAGWTRTRLAALEEILGGLIVSVHLTRFIRFRVNPLCAPTRAIVKTIVR